MSERQTAVRDLSDEELIANFQRGDVAAFNVLVGRYKDQLMNFVFRYLGSYDEADDVVQETFVRVYRNKQSYQPIAKFSTWIYTIATNLAKTQLSRRKRHMWFSLSRKSDENEEKVFEIPDSRYSPDGETERSMQQEMIQNALNSLPDKFRETVVLFDIQERTYEEICEITGLPIGTVKSRLNRGRERLRKLLKDLMNE